MPKKLSIAIILIIIFLNSTILNAKGLEYAEIFDPKQGKVVQVVQLNERIRNMVLELKSTKDGVRDKQNPILTGNEYIIKVSLDPKVKIHKNWLKDNIKDIYIVFPEIGSPFFMYFKNEDKISCFPFNGDVDALSKTLTLS